MHVTRAHIAGFGTAGSLLAGAAVLFMIAAAIVSQRGWPEVASAGSAPALVLPRTAIYGVGGSTASQSVSAGGSQAVASASSARDAAGATAAANKHTSSSLVSTFPPDLIRHRLRRTRHR